MENTTNRLLNAKNVSNMASLKLDARLVDADARGEKLANRASDSKDVILLRYVC